MPKMEQRLPGCFGAVDERQKVLLAGLEFLGKNVLTAAKTLEKMQSLLRRLRPQKTTAVTCDRYPRRWAMR